MVPSPYRALAWGTFLAAVYAVVALASIGALKLPARPLYDGLAPLPPYNWVNPPPELAKDNQSAMGVTASIALTSTGSAAGTIATNDLQAVVLFPENAFGPRARESAVRVTITPLDPLLLGRPPQGTRFDGNAYRFEVVYNASGAPVPLRRPATILLRYPVHATELLRLRDGEWVPLQTTAVYEGMQVYAQSAVVGVFVAAAPLLR